MLTVTYLRLFVQKVLTILFSSLAERTSANFETAPASHSFQLEHVLQISFPCAFIERGGQFPAYLTPRASRFSAFSYACCLMKGSLHYLT